MLAQVAVPGYGQALAGLDWLEVPGEDGKRNEIKQLGRGVEASWEYVWNAKGQGGVEDKCSVAFVNKNESRKRPIAAAALVRVAIPDLSFLALIDLGDDRYWLFALKDGMPGSKMDLVGEANEVVSAFRDFVNTLEKPTEFPIYTDKPEVLPSLAFELDVRHFSLEILGHSIQKRDFSKAAFRRHTSAPIIPIVICIGLIAACFVYQFYKQQAEEDARRNASKIRDQAIAQRKQELAAAVSTALNSTVPASIAIPAYLDATQHLERLVEGWKLTAIECESQACTLTYSAQAFATWAGYLRAKPPGWPAPVFDSDINKVTQPIEVNLPERSPRTVEALPTRERVRLGLGNLAQISRNIGLTVTLPSTWNRVAGNPALGSPEEQWVPMSGSFNATGSAVLLKDLAKRLPDTSDVSSVSFKLDDPITFDLKGKAYANP